MQVQAKAASPAKGSWKKPAAFLYLTNPSLSSTLHTLVHIAVLQLLAMVSVLIKGYMEKKTGP